MKDEIKLGSKNSVRSATHLGQLISRSGAFGLFEIPKIFVDSSTP